MNRSAAIHRVGAGARRVLRGLATLGLAGMAAQLAGCGGGGNTASSASASGAGPGPTTYTVGGTVSGLTGSGLTLQINGAGTLPVAANATSFTFAGSFTTGQSYTVTVSAQPSNPAQTCTLGNASGTIGSASIANVAVSCTAVSAGNVATITLDSFNNNSGGNTPYVSVRICAPGSTSNCQTIDHITVDTGSFGLRILNSALNAGLLAALPNVNGTAGPFLAECQQFGSGYTWGSVRSVDFTIPNTGESVSGLPVQIIGDLEPAPQACSTQAVVSGQMLGNTGYMTPAAFGANGLIGVGPFPQDCGACASIAQPTSNGVSYFVYTTCSSATASASCSTAGTRAPLAKQVINPVSDFSVDNNGVIITLPAVSATGVPSLSGTMTFGIATSSGNNGLGNATVYLADPSSAYVTTVYKGVTDTHSFIDSGSNGLYFNDSSLTQCTGNAKGFYCPGGSTSPYSTGGVSSVSETATFEDYNGMHPTPIAFTVENAFLTDVVASGLTGTGTSNEFDWGVPFFFGRTVYTAIGYKADGTPITIGNNAAPFYAF